MDPTTPVRIPWHAQQRWFYGGMLAAALVELVALHLLVGRPWLRWTLDVLGVAGVVAVLWSYRQLTRSGHLVDAEGVELHGPGRLSVRVPWHRVAAIRERRRDTSGQLVHEQRLQLGVLDETRIDLVLTEPIEVHLPCGRTATVTEVAFTADDVPAALRLLRQAAQAAAAARDAG